MMTSPNPHPPFVGSGGLEGRSAAAGRSAQSLGGGWILDIRYPHDRSALKWLPMLGN